MSWKNDVKAVLRSHGRVDGIPAWKEMLIIFLVVAAAFIPTEAILYGLAVWHARLLAPEIQQCEAAGGHYHCLHAMCHCHK